jgi:hypothetical protein
MTIVERMTFSLTSALRRRGSDVFQPVELPQK